MRLVSILIWTELLFVQPGRADVTIDSTHLTVGAAAGGNTVVSNWIGGAFSVAAPVLVGSGSANNSVTVSNFAITSASQSSIGGSGNGNNSLTLLANTTWNQGNTILALGTSANGNSLTINGGLIRNISEFDFAGNSTGNSLVITNGGKLITASAYLAWGGSSTASNNTITVTGPGSVWTNTGAFYYAGQSGNGTRNSLTIANGGKLIENATAGTGVEIGYGISFGSNNAVIVRDPGSLMQIASGNFLRVGGSGQGNSILVTNQGVLEVNLFAFSIYTGNTISNVGGVYQFTALPQNGLGTAAGITINNGTISYRATTAADVRYNSGADGLSAIALQMTGTNTFMLNAATNTSSSQTYTFGTVPGNPTNYANLVMVNGATAYRGGNLTIGQTGSLLISNTTALITGVFTNSGSLSVVNAYATFQSSVSNSGTNRMLNSVGTFNGSVVNSGAWITDPTTNVFNGDHVVTSSGYISAAAGDVYRFRSNFVNQSIQTTQYDTLNTTPGASGAAGTKFIFDGTNTVSSTGYTQKFFTAGLQLTGGFVGTPTPLATGVQTVSTFAAVSGFIDNFALDRLEIGATGTNSLLQLSSTFGLSNSGNTNALFVNDLWIFGSSQLIISNNTMLYFVNSNNWSTANYQLLGNAELHQLVLGDVVVAVVPEPTVALLWLAGIGTIYASRRRQRRARRPRV